MTKTQFEELYGKLGNKFNTQYQKRYDEQVARLFWLEIADMPFQWFKFQVDLAIGDMKHITLSKLKESAIRKRNQMKDFNKQESVNIFDKTGNATEDINILLMELGSNSLLEHLNKIKSERKKLIKYVGEDVFRSVSFKLEDIDGYRKGFLACEDFLKEKIPAIWASVKFSAKSDEEIYATGELCVLGVLAMKKKDMEVA